MQQISIQTEIERLSLALSLSWLLNRFPSRSALLAVGEMGYLGSLFVIYIRGDLVFNSPFIYLGTAVTLM